jgi:hypothetical protein
MKLEDFNRAKPIVDALEQLRDIEGKLQGRKVARVTFLVEPEGTVTSNGGYKHGSRSVSVGGRAAEVIASNIDAFVQAEIEKAEKALAKIGSK